jgi:hypothetical protein
MKALLTLAGIIVALPLALLMMVFIPGEEWGKLNDDLKP